MANLIYLFPEKVNPLTLASEDDRLVYADGKGVGGRLKKGCGNVCGFGCGNLHREVGKGEAVIGS